MIIAYVTYTQTLKELETPKHAHTNRTRCKLNSQNELLDQQFFFHDVAPEALLNRNFMGKKTLKSYLNMPGGSENIRLKNSIFKPILIAGHITLFRTFPCETPQPPWPH